MSTVAREVRIRGRVQGVFFRDSCQREADQHGVAGWVTNEADGSVSAYLEGDREAVDALVLWCRTGPPRADVTAVEVRETFAQGLGGFEVR